MKPHGILGLPSSLIQERIVHPSAIVGMDLTIVVESALRLSLDVLGHTSLVKDIFELDNGRRNLSLGMPPR